jgi:glutamate dehydrogenase
MLQEEIGETAPDIVRAFMVVIELFDLQGLFNDVEALDNQITATVQLNLIIEIRQHIERASRWLLRHHHLPLDIPKTIAALHSGVVALADNMLNLIGKTEREHLENATQALIDAGVPATLAIRIARLETWLSALDIVEIANTTKEKLDTVTTVHFMLGRQLKLYWLRQKISELPRDNRWTALSRSSLRDELYRTHRELTTVVLQNETNAWMENNATRLKRCQEVLAEIFTIEKPYLAMLSVGLREIRNLL